ncbi:MAG: ABC transporter ATP-binding protein [Alphaproteobacteria bacterium]|nr:ABC transporter ATP-binding protein [Alphaproteobacteria bacterium]
MLELHAVVKRYGATLGAGPIDLTVEPGEFLTLLGPSGCGKTTTLHLIAGLHAPDEGRILMDGTDLTQVPPQRRNMGVVFQNYALFPHRTVTENVAFGLRMRGVTPTEIASKVGRMLDLVGLPGTEGRLPRQLSGGQQQRVALARALVIEPRVLLLDEPLSNLDAVLRKRMRADLRAIQRRLGITAIAVTHDQDEAFEMSDRVALMDQGRIEQLSTPEGLYDRPATRFAAEFIGEAVFVPGRIGSLVGGRARVATESGLGFDGIPCPDGLGVGAAVYVLIRPERIDLILDDAAPAGAIEAEIVDRVFSGEQVSLSLRVAGGLVLKAKKPSLGRFRDLAPGRKLRLLAQDPRLVPRTDGAT